MQENNQKGSILDEIITSQTEIDLAELNPRELVFSLLKGLPERTEKIVLRRYGLTGAERETLEEIGHSYNITRERVRQIESAVFDELRASRRLDLIEPLEEIIETTLEEHGRVMEHAFLVANLLEKFKKETADERVVEFILEVSDRFNRHEETEELRKAWSLRDGDLSLVASVIAACMEILEREGKPLSGEHLPKHLMSHEKVAPHHDRVDEKALLAYLKLSKKLHVSPFDEWGFTHWKEVVPKGVKDKAYLVLKKNNKPMHFTEITDAINKNQFDHRTAVPQTVHNELIKDKRFVLVGRGMYALTEWGYKPGTVADVIQELLHEKARPMTRKEIVDAVLDRRIVKRNTIILALQDKDMFTKVQKDTFDLAKK